MNQLPAKKPVVNLEDSDTDSDSDSDFYFPWHNCIDLTYGLEIKTNNISHFGYNLRAAITNCEIMILDYNKWQRELSPVAGPSNAAVQVDVNAPSCSGTSANAGGKVGPDAATNPGSSAGANSGANASGHADAFSGTVADDNASARANAGTNSSLDAGGNAGANASVDAGANASVDAGANAVANANVDAGANGGANANVDAGANAGANAGGRNEIDIFSEHQEELAEYVRQLNYRRTRNNEIQTLGSWLFISHVNGGWDYDTVRNYLLEQFGVTCMRSRAIPDVLVTNKKFKAIIKFESTEQLNHVVMSLRQNHVHDNFLFLSFDKLPIDLGSDFSDSDSDASRSGFLIPVTNEFHFQ